jgi:hypothetical protein
MTVQSSVIYQSAVDLLKAIPEIQGKIIGVYDDEELLNKLKAVPTLGVGVIYDGMRPEGESKTSHKIGAAAVLGITIVLVLKEIAFAQGLDYRTPGMSHMDAIRQKFMDTKSPAGHYWEFMAEAPAVQKSDVIIWVQRWQTPVMLTRENSV